MRSEFKAGIYGRAFEWNIAKVEKEAIPTIAEAFVALSAKEHLDIFEDYLAISRRRKNNLLALVKLQLHLIDDLVVLQSTIKHYRKKWDELKAQLENQQTNEQLKQDLKFLQRELFFHRAYANCIRGIGDGIAWRALAYDRVALRALSGSAVKQQIVDQGSVNELRHWANAFDTGKGLPIFNAMTNWLALGDITVVKHDGVVEIVEVKTSGAGSNRVTRQRQRMREATDFLRNGKGTLEGENVTVMRLNVPLENNFPALQHLLEQAGKTGWSAAFINKVAYVEAFDARAEGSRIALQNGIEATKKNLEIWRASGDIVMRLDSSGIVSFTPNCAPVAVFPFSERLCVELLTSAKTYTCSLNLTEIGREFERYGWHVEKSPREYASEATSGKPSAFFRLEKDGLHFEIPPADIMRITMETLNPKYLIETLEFVLKSGPGATSTASYFAYEAEKNLWS